MSRPGQARYNATVAIVTLPVCSGAEGGHCGQWGGVRQAEAGNMSSNWSPSWCLTSRSSKPVSSSLDILPADTVHLLGLLSSEDNKSTPVWATDTAPASPPAACTSRYHHQPSPAQPSPAQPSPAQAAQCAGSSQHRQARHQVQLVAGRSGQWCQHQWSHDKGHVTSDTVTPTQPPLSCV